MIICSFVTFIRTRFEYCSETTGFGAKANRHETHAQRLVVVSGTRISRTEFSVMIFNEIMPYNTLLDFGPAPKQHSAQSVCVCFVLQHNIYLC